jgi:hypothetical protein
MRLYCVSPYRGTLNHRLVVGVPGQSIELDDDAEAEWLLRDSPESWHKSESVTFKRIAKGGTSNRMVAAETVNDRSGGEAMSSESFGAVKG